MKNAYFVVLAALGYLLGLFGLAGGVFFVYLIAELGPSLRNILIAIFASVFGFANLVLSTVLLRMCLRGDHERRGFKVVDSLTNR